MSTRLYRSRDDRMLAGVAGGLAELWDADPSLIRILWALLVVFTGGIALIVYLVMAIVVPEEPDVYDVPGTVGAPGTEPGVATATDPAMAAAGSAPMAPAASITDARLARREARRRARAGRGSGSRTGAIVIGALFILLGSWFLIREYLPTIDWDWFWPVTLVAVGVLVLIAALRPADGGVSQGDRT